MTLSYAETLDYIYGFTDYKVKPQHRYAPDVIDPDRPARLLEALGNPHLDYCTIHIAGTKGKGSTAAICASVLRSGGWRTGLFTSPHLQSFRERIQVGSACIPPEDLADLIEEIRPAVDRVQGITTFEVITILAFLYFNRQQVDVGVVEVGLGGRLDATNVVQPLVTIITTLGFDHTYLLGETLAEIAAEKGGIIKPGVPVVCVPQKAGALAVLKRIAADKEAPLTQVGRDWWFEAENADLEGQSFYAGAAGKEGKHYSLPLLGEHQLINATAALAALDIVSHTSHLALSQDAKQQGLAKVDWPGRFQILQHRPAVVVDAAHNIDSVRAVRRTLEAIFPGRHCILVFGVTADKDVHAIIQELMPVADKIIVTAASHARAARPDDLLRQLEENGFEATAMPDVLAALTLALDIAEPEDVICVTGSMFVAGAALDAWDEKRGLQPERDGVVE